MNFAKRLTAGIILCIFLLGLAACDSQEAPPATPTEPLVAAAEAYETAKAQLLAAPNRILTYTTTTSSTIDGQAYTQSVEGTASFSNVGTDDMIAVVEEKLVYGTVSADYLLSFCNGRAYSRISGSTFGAEMTAEDFLATQLPAALLDTSLYESIAYRTHADGTGILFTQPKSLESWVNAPKGAQQVIASGLAILDSTGALIQTEYTAEYSCGDTAYYLQITLKCTTPAQLELSALHPEHPDEYAVLACLDAPKLLLQAAGHIFSAKNLSADAEETIFSEIIPLTRQRKSQIAISGTSDTLKAMLANTISITDYRDQPSVTTQTYLFQNGVCTSSIDGSDPTVQAGITAETMRTSIEDTLLSALFAPRYLAGATLTEEEGVYRLDFTGNEAYCSDLTRDLSAFLNLSMEGVTSHHSTEANGYLCIDKVTGLPVAMGMYFSRTHMFGDIPYVLSYQLDQAVNLSPAV